MDIELFVIECGSWELSDWWEVDCWAGGQDGCYGKCHNGDVGGMLDELCVVELVCDVEVYCPQEAV